MIMRVVVNVFRTVGNHKTRLTELKEVASGELDGCWGKEGLRGYRVIINLLEIIIF